MGLFDRFSKPPPVVRDVWNGYAYRFGGGERCVVSFDVAACDPKEQKPSELRRIICFAPEEHVGPTGMPSPEMFARMRAIEDAAVKALTEAKVRAWLIGKQVYRGMRELLFQVDDLAGFAKVYEALDERFGGMKLIEHADWKFFNDKIKPDARAFNHMGNRDVLMALRDAGADFDQVHVLDHTFVGPTEALEEIEAVMTEQGYAGRVNGESLTMSGEHPLDQDELDDTTMRLRAMAADLGAAYDGWGTMPKRKSAN